MQDDSLIPISALQHFIFCPRQCALIHIERIWNENYFTAAGRVMHENAHSKQSSSINGVRIARSLQVKSKKLGLFGETDIVEFHKTENGIKIFPVEYKLGKPKEHDADAIQLCAQAMCLEEMLDSQITCGALFYGKLKHRTDVIFDADLRNKTINAANALHEFLAAGNTPKAEYSNKKCSACSFLEMCRPQKQGTDSSVEKYFKSFLEEL